MFGGEGIQRPLLAAKDLCEIRRASWGTSEFRGLMVDRHKTKSPINATELLRQERKQLYC